jgi:hypothetical protein
MDFQRNSGTTTGKIDTWVATWYYSGSTGPTFLSPDTLDLVANPATGDSIISVGAYTTKYTWTNGNGQPAFYASYPPMWHIANFSSQGPRRDGKMAPDIAAPGYGIAAALASSIASRVSAGQKVEDQLHYMNFGTSQAAAHGAGAAALLLENAKKTSAPKPAPATIRAKFAYYAKIDSYVGPSYTWGVGKLHLPNSFSNIVAVGDPVISSHITFSSVYPNPSRSRTSFEFALSSEDLAGAAKVQLGIFDIRGRQIASIAGIPKVGYQQMSWNGDDADGSRAPAGLYVARLEVGTHSALQKFLRF